MTRRSRARLGCLAAIWLVLAASGANLADRAIGAPAPQTDDALASGASARVGGTDGAGLRVRAAPGTSAPVRGVLPDGTLVEVVEGPVDADGLRWYHIRATAGDTVGWTVDQYLLASAAPGRPGAAASDAPAVAIGAAPNQPTAVGPAREPPAVAIGAPADLPGTPGEPTVDVPLAPAGPPSAAPAAPLPPASAGPLAAPAGPGVASAAPANPANGALPAVEPGRGEELAAPAAASPTPAPSLTPTLAATPTITATATLTSSPTVTPTATPPPAGTVLYEASWAGGLGDWIGTADWQVADGMLANDGRRADLSLIAPRGVRSPVSDYAIEAEIARISGDGFGIFVRRSDEQRGYLVGSYHNFAVISAREPFNSFASRDFRPGAQWRKYRVEVRGNSFRLTADTTRLFDATDDRYSSGTQFGLWSVRGEIRVRSFKLIAL